MLLFALSAKRILHQFIWENFVRSEAFIIIVVMSLIFVKYSPDLKARACAYLAGWGRAGFRSL